MDRDLFLVFRGEPRTGYFDRFFHPNVYTNFYCFVRAPEHASAVPLRRSSIRVSSRMEARLE